MKVFLLLLLSGLVSWVLATVPFERFGADLNYAVNDTMMAFLPLPPPSDKVVTLGILGPEDGAYFLQPSYANLRVLLEQVMAQEPLAVISTVHLPSQNQDPNQVRDFVAFAGKFKNLYFYSYYTPGEPENLRHHPILGGLQQIFVPLTHDQGVVRRVIYSMEIESGWINSPLLDLLNRYGIERSVEEYPAFDFGKSRQGYMRYRSFADLALVPFQRVRQESGLLTGKIVVIGPSFDNEQGDYRARTIFSRFVGDWSRNITAAQRIALDLHVLLKKDALLQAPFWLRFLLIFLLLSLYVLGIYRLPVISGFLWGFAVLALLLLVTVGAYAFFGYLINLATAGLTLAVGHLLSSSFLITRYLRARDRALAEQERRLEVQRLQGDLLVKSARADQGLKIAMQVAHDIRSPLSAIRIATQRTAGAQNPEAAKLIFDSVSRLQNIADDLLERYRNDDFSEEKSEAMVNLFDLLSGLSDGYRSSWSRMSLHIEGDEELFITLPNKTDFERAICNLLNNSLEAKPHGTIQVKIAFEHRENRVEIHIQDDGPGIAHDKLEQIFAPGTTFGKAGGSGLGLTQVREALAKAGGSVRALPSGHGAHFVLELAQNRKPAEHLKIHRSVVVAEDNARTRERWVKRLTAAGAKVQAITRPEEFGSLDLRPPYTLITDLIFDGSARNGFDLLEQTRRHECQRILCSSLARNPSVRDVALRLADHVFTKSEFGSLALTLQLPESPL